MLPCAQAQGVGFELLGSEKRELVLASLSLYVARRFNRPRRSRASAALWYSTHMQILDKKLKQQIKRASRKTGLPEREVVQRAVSSYLGSVEELAVLQEELHMWDTLAAETMRKHGL